MARRYERDEFISAAFEAVQNLCGETGGSFDLLVNAGIASAPGISVREIYTAILDINVASIAVIMDTTPQNSQHALGGHIINVSSIRGSLLMNTENKVPPSQSIPYSVSKAALNLLTVDYARNWKGKVRINAISPGHCATSLNGFRGTKNVKDGAKVARCWNSGIILIRGT